jgi:hypothetical protein
MQKQSLSLLLLLLLILPGGLAGCARIPQPVARADGLGDGRAPVAPPAFVTLPADQAIPQLIAAEREASRRGDLLLLAQLWAPDGRIVDGRGTGDPADDFTWPDRAAILDRYRLAVFPAPPPPLAGLPAPALTVQGDAAQAVNGGDRWLFRYAAGRWWIAELRY